MSNFAERLSQRLYRWLWNMIVPVLRVPREAPSLPVASGGVVETFQPAPAFLSYLKFWFWLALLGVDLALLAMWIVIAVANLWIGLLLLPLAAFIIVAPDIIVYIGLHLRYDSTWYVMTERAIRIRRGLWVIRETTITFENVQNVKVRQGPLQRYYGIADVTIETAGGGGSTGPHGNRTGGHHGVIEGIADAQRVRDVILQRLRASTKAGLGDEGHEAERDDHTSRAHALSTVSARARWNNAHLEALRAIRDEIRGIKASARA